MKIGVGITTYNAEHYFKDLYDSLPIDKIEIFIDKGIKDFVLLNMLKFQQLRHPS